MAYPVLSIANKILAYGAAANDEGELFSNMKLQKLLYYVQGFHIAVLIVLCLTKTLKPGCMVLWFLRYMNITKRTEIKESCLMKNPLLWKQKKKVYLMKCFAFMETIQRLV